MKYYRDGNHGDDYVLIRVSADRVAVYSHSHGLTDNGREPVAADLHESAARH